MAQDQNNIAVCGVRFVYYLYEPVLCNLLNPRQHGDMEKLAMEKLAKELLGLFAVIIIGVAILAVWWYVYELTQRSVVTWAVGVLLAFAVMHIGKKWSYP